MEKFMEEVAKELVKRYNQKNNTHFTEYWEIHTDIENKRIKANMECLTKLYEISHKEEVK